MARCLAVHREKLSEIKSKSKRKLQSVERPQMELLKQVNLIKFRNHIHNLTERDAQIRRSNKILLERLVGISAGRSVNPDLTLP